MRTPSRKLLAALLVVCFAVSSAKSEDILNLDLSGVGDPGVRAALLRDEAYLQAVLRDWSPRLPRWVRNQLRPVEIVVNLDTIDGPGGILGQAATTEQFEFGIGPNSGAVAQAGELTIDIEDGYDIIVARHEILHALGFNPNIWELNNANNQDGYIGQEGLSQWRTLVDATAGWIPLEQQGGGGTAGAHLDSLHPYISGNHLIMQGFYDALTDPNNLSLVEQAMMIDVGFAAYLDTTEANSRRFFPRFPKNGNRSGTGGNGPPLALQAVPEPGTFGVLALASALGLGFVRRRRR